jgi:muramoyltetrapeptide carboxypeptidase
VKLVAGDTVAIIAPASQLPSKDRELLPRAVDLLESWGLTVRVAVDHGNWFYLAGKDAVRAHHVEDALGDSSVRAVFCMRGGYGSSRILRQLKCSPTPKIVVGYSDITALHAYLAAKHPGVALVHGPNVATNQLLGSGPGSVRNRESLRDALFDSDYKLVESIEVLRGGSAVGNLFGGCLTVLASLIGTPYLPNLDNAILFLEDAGEAPYRIDRLLTQLTDSGSLDRVSGVIFGPMHKCADPYNDIRAVIADALSRLTVPIGFGLGSGHGPLNLSLPLGAPVRLDADAGSLVVGADVVP